MSSPGHGTRVIAGLPLAGERLLPSHRDPEPLVRCDQVVDVLGLLVKVDLDPRTRPVKRLSDGP